MQVKPIALKKKSANVGSGDEFAGGEGLFNWESNMTVIISVSFSSLFI